MAAELRGECQCGGIRYEVTGVPQQVVVCHCTDCQRQSGSAFGMTLYQWRSAMTVVSPISHSD